MGKNTQNKDILTREFSSGGIVFKKEGQKTYWLIRKTSKSNLFPTSYWMLPKGWIDNDAPDIPGPMTRGLVKADKISLENTAIREVREETGIEAKIIKKIGTSMYTYIHPKNGKIMKFVTFFLMEWIRDLPEGFDWETSEIAWLTFEEAYKKLSFGGEKSILKKAKELL